MSAISKHNELNYAGVYILQSKAIPTRFYIGSALLLLSRKRQHIQQLKGGYHINKLLQDHCNKFGADDLSFKVIERHETPYFRKSAGELRKWLRAKEMYYITTMQPYFNQTLKNRHPQEVNELLNQL